MPRVGRRSPSAGLRGACLLAGLVAVAAGCSDAPRAGVSQVTYTPIPAGHDYPADPAALLAAVAAGDQKRLSEHAWHLWAGLNAPSGQLDQDKELPIWETWFAPDELYALDPSACVLPERPRSMHRHLEVPRQVGDFAARTPASVVTAFNRYSLEVVENVCANHYDSSSTLDALNASFGAATPVVARSITDFAERSIALKPTFALVKGSGVTVMSYWAGAQASSCPTQPQPLTWNRCVAVVPPGTPVPSSPTQVACTFAASCDAANATPPGPFTTVETAAPVIPLDRFYSFRLKPDEVADVQALIDGGGAFFANGATPEPGDYLVLVAMHVTTKELPRWTWQTFWWSPFPDDGPGGEFRTADVTGEFRNYQTCTADSMLDPAEPGDGAAGGAAPSGQPVVCFNPYLETGLDPQGQFSNCMTCHQLAAWPNFSTNYQFSGYISPADPGLFDCNTKLDFLWSVTRAVPVESPAQPCSGSPSRAAWARRLH